MWFLCCVVLFIIFLFFRLTVGITNSSACLLGKTALVTGANSGIGYQTALNLASRGCRVIMADVEDMEKSKAKIISLTNNPAIISKHLDLSSLKSVRDFAHEIKKTEAKLDILINNAGIFASRENRTQDGLNPAMQINYFGHFLLTHLLIDLLKKAAPSRIVFTSSFMSWYNNLELENLNYDDTSDNMFSKIAVYSNSKYAMLIASDIFARKLKGSGVTSNSINPGIVNSRMAQTAFDFYSCLAIPQLILNAFFKYFCKTTWEGSQVLVHVAVARELEETTGKHFWDCRSFFKPLKAYNREFCQQIWDASEKFVNLTDDERLM